MWLEPLAQEERDESSRRDGVLLGEREQQSALLELASRCGLAH
jgi:hypothetical protein